MNRIAAAIVVLAGSVQLSVGCFGAAITNASGPTVLLMASGALITLGGLVAMLFARSNV